MKQVDQQIPKSLRSKDAPIRIRAHNPEVVGSNPTPATSYLTEKERALWFSSESPFSFQRGSSMILQGYFRILSFFDIAEAIDLDKLRALLGPEAAPRAPAFRHRVPEYSQVQQAPIVESVKSITLQTGDKLDARIK